MSEDEIKQGFGELGLRNSLLKAVAAAGFAAPLEIQQKAIPEILAGRDLVGVAETGSGKTLAYGLPLIQRVKEREEALGVVERAGSPRALVLVPTRELAAQVRDVLKSFSHETRVRVRVMTGGEGGAQRAKGAYDVLVATPGRLLRYVEQGRIDLSGCGILVLDEADELFAMGFLRELEGLLGRLPEGRQLLLFSATLPAAVRRIIKDRFGAAVILQTRAAHKPTAALSSERIQVSPKRKLEELAPVLGRLGSGKGLVFTNSKERCRVVAAKLRELVGDSVDELHADLEGVARRAAVRRFRSGAARILVATDLAARGLDILDIDWILNYDLPPAPAPYLHRVGRTARLGRDGRVIDFVTHEDREMVEKLRQQSVRKSPFELTEPPRNVRRKGPERPEPEARRPQRGGARPRRP